MTGRFRDYLDRQLKNYLLIVVISTVLIFVLLSIGTLQIYTNYRLRQDNKNVLNLLSNDVELINETILTIEDNDLLLKSFLVDEMYALRQKSNVKFNFMITDHEMNLIATNLYSYNTRELLASEELRSALRQMDVLDEKSAVENAVNRNSGPQVSAMTIVYRTEHLYLVFEPLYSSLIELESQLSSNLLLSDRYDNVLYDNSRLFQDSLGKTKINLSDNATVESSIIPYNITITSIKERAITPQVLTYTLLTLFVTLFMLIMLLNFVIKKVVTKLDEPLDELLTAISSNKGGSLDYFIDSNYFLEFDKIYQEFNELVHSTKELMTKNEELSETKKSMEIKHLKNQFNPHFIYNALESIRYEVMFDQSNASNMILSLGRLMQYSVENTNSLVTVEEDITYLEDYLKLQKMRFKERLEYNISIDESLSNKKIPKLLLQPLVENSIKHNMDSVHKLVIDINGTITNGTIQFNVIDDGKGMSDEDIHELTESFKQIKTESNDLGLYNINRTIELMYGNEYGLEIINGKGLKIKVTLPYTERASE